MRISSPIPAVKDNAIAIGRQTKRIGRAFRRAPKVGIEAAKHQAALQIADIMKEAIAIMVFGQAVEEKEGEN